MDMKDTTRVILNDEIQHHIKGNTPIYLNKP